MNRILFFTTVLFALSEAKSALVLLDRIAVVVDEDVIMLSEVEARVTTVKAQIATSGEVPPDDVLTEQVVERLIIEHLQVRMAERAGMRIGDAELNDTIQRIAAQNNLTLSQFQQAIEQDGMSYVAMREQVRRELTLSQVQQGVMSSRIEISEQEMKNFLASELGEAIVADEYRLAHILITAPEAANATEISAVRKKALDLISRVENGESFQALAIEHSAGQNALKGGDLGWRKPVQLPTMFADVAQAMAVGEINGPIKSGSGFHIVTLTDKRGAKTQGQIAQTRARHVLVKPSEIRSETEAQELAENLLIEVTHGRDFEEIAKLYSEDPGSALNGGDLDWNQAGIFVPEFETMIHTLDLNVLSPVFKTSHGYHFLEVTGRRIEDFSEQFQQNMAAEYLRGQKFDEELNTWLREIREEAFVDIRI